MKHFNYNNCIDILKELNFNLSSFGFHYWIFAIYEYTKSINKFDNTIETVYLTIADKMLITRNQVERGMRTARKNTDEYIRNKYKYKGKLTNKNILILICMEEKEKLWKLGGINNG